MLKHLLNAVIGHVSGLSDAQLEQIEQALPVTRSLIDLLIKAQPFFEQAQTLYAEAEPLMIAADSGLKPVPGIQERERAANRARLASLRQFAQHLPPSSAAR